MVAVVVGIALAALLVWAGPGDGAGANAPRVLAGAALIVLVGVLYVVVAGRTRGSERGGGAAGGPLAGEIWWADVPFADTDESKDRPCLVLNSHGRDVVVLKITSADRSGRRDCLALPAGAIDDPTGGSRRSWLELKEVRTVPRGSFRRVAGRCDDATWRRIGRLRGADAAA